MLEKIKQKKIDEGTIEAEQVDEVELPTEEVSGMWKSAIIAYSLALPLAIASPIMFLFFTQEMMKGEVCKFYELAQTTDADTRQADCLANYDSDPSKYIEGSGFRYPAFIMALALPAAYGLIEFFLNQLLMTWRHILYQFIFTIFFALVTMLWQVSTGDATIFPGALDWVCASREGGEDGCIFDECILWFIVFIGVQSGCYSLILFLHYLKTRFCCKRSVPIKTYSEIAPGQLSNITAQRKSSVKKD